MFLPHKLSWFIYGKFLFDASKLWGKIHHFVKQMIVFMASGPDHHTVVSKLF